MTPISREILQSMRVPYALRRVASAAMTHLIQCPNDPPIGTIALATLTKIGKNARLELADGRLATLHEGDTLAVVFGNRYATAQFEGYARSNGETCDLLSIGGLCGVVASKHATVAEPSKLRILGAVADSQGRALRLRDFTVHNSLVEFRSRPRVIVVCGTSMDSGKTYTAMSLIVGLQRQGQRVAGIKLTGTAAGRDTWAMRDAGACVALDFVDAGYPSTFLCEPREILNMYDKLISHAAIQRADWVVMEIADGLLQSETAALLQSASFTSEVSAWVFATGDPLGAIGGVSTLKRWDIRPLVISGLISQSPLGTREVEDATGIRCLTAQQLQRGELNRSLNESPFPCRNAGSDSVREDTAA